SSLTVEALEAIDQLARDQSSAVSAALRGLFCQLLDGCQARVPPCGGSCQGGAGLIEAFLANGVANFAAASLGRDETVALEDGEVFGDALSRDGHRARERARCGLTALEQEVEQAYPHWVAERGPQTVGFVGARRHRPLLAPTMRAT